MRLLLDIALAIIVATTIGFSSAWLAVEQGRLFGSVTIGSWTAWPGAGSADADPYSVALLARSGEVPLGASEGLAFAAIADSQGDPLTGRCIYSINGQTPPARLWTLAAYDNDGSLIFNAARRPGFHSREILRNADGRFDIVASPDVEPGNWLPTARREELQFVLRLYDTPLTAASEFENIDMPRIDRVRCG